MVRDDNSITESEALRDSVTNLIAASVLDLLKKKDGKQVILDSGTVTLHTREATSIAGIR